MPNDQDLIRISRLADERLAGLQIATADRPAARRAMIASITKEETEAQTASTAIAEATAERARINAIVQKGSDYGKPRQALRLALSGPVTVEQAANILPTLAREDDGGPAATLDLSGLPVFGTKAEQAERKRIATIFTSDEAGERFTAAGTFALRGDIPADAVAAMLKLLPKEAVRERYLTIAERAAGLPEAGADPFGGQYTGMSKDEKTKTSWSKAIKEANESIGAKSTSPQSSPVPPSTPELDANVPDWAKAVRR